MAEEVQAENEVVAEESNETTSPVVEENTSEQTEGAEAQAETTEETSSERKPKPAENRIRELNERTRRLEQENQMLQSQQQSPQFPQYQPGEEIQPERLQQDVVQTAQAIADITVNNRIAQERAANNVERDTEVLPTKYAELNPDSPEYSPELEQVISEEFQKRAFRVTGHRPDGQPILALDPSVRLADIAKSYTETARAVAGKQSANMRNAVAQTADTAAIKPQGESKSEKPFAEKSIKEMEAELGFAKR